MASSLHMLLPTLVFLLHFPAITTSQECPYPCYPPPIGPGNGPPATTTPPASTSTTPASFSPPFSSTNTPAGVFPFTQPPPYFYGVATPPPDPILSWFPYYFRKPLHQDQSSSTALRGSGTAIVIFHLFIVLSFVFH